MESILESIKKLLGIEADDKNFDKEIIMHINGVISTLTQLGVGASAGFIIMDDTDTWDDFFGGEEHLEFIKTYVFLRVRLLFDPPQSSFLLDAITKQIEELTWRINSEVDSAFHL